MQVKVHKVEVTMSIYPTSDKCSKAGKGKTHMNSSVGGGGGKCGTGKCETNDVKFEGPKMQYWKMRD